MNTQKIKNKITQKYIQLLKIQPQILIDLGATNCRATLRTQTGKKILPIINPTQQQTKVQKNKKQVLKAIKKTTKNYLKITKNPPIKIAIPGIIKQNKVTIPNLKIKNWNLKKDLQKIFNTNKIHIINDAVATYKGEKTNGTIIRIGTGIGAAENNKNIELGRSITLPKYKFTGYTNHPKILENFSSGLALKKIGEKKGLKIKCTPNEYAQKINQLTKKNNKLAKKILTEAGETLGHAINSYHQHKKHKNTHEYIISGSLGLNQHYFKGIQKTSKLNIKKSKHKNSEAIYQGLTKITLSTY